MPQALDGTVSRVFQVREGLGRAQPSADHVRGEDGVEPAQGDPFP